MDTQKTIEASYLLELMNAFIWLDQEHQRRAVKAVEAVLRDQIAEKTGEKKGI